VRICRLEELGGASDDCPPTQKRQREVVEDQGQQHYGFGQAAFKRLLEATKLSNRTSAMKCKCEAFELLKEVAEKHIGIVLRDANATTTMLRGKVRMSESDLVNARSRNAPQDLLRRPEEHYAIF
jgi:hypothetical protein